MKLRRLPDYCVCSWCVHRVDASGVHLPVAHGLPGEDSLHMHAGAAQQVHAPVQVPRHGGGSG